MFNPDEISKIEAALAEKGVSVAEFCRDAKIDASTWTRWKSKRFMPSFRAAQRVTDEFQKIISPKNKTETGATQ